MTCAVPIMVSPSNATATRELRGTLTTLKKTLAVSAGEHSEEICPGVHPPKHLCMTWPACQISAKLAASRTLTQGTAVEGAESAFTRPKRSCSMGTQSQSCVL